MKEKFKKYKEEYYSIEYVYCPVLDSEKVYFNNYGFNHLVRKMGVKRYLWDSKRRFKIFKYAKIIIESSNIQVEYRMNKYEFWALTQIVYRKKIKVILRRINKGKIHFYSIFEIKN